ncbi:MAG TPA: AI-2E family transporter [Candidatus Deferrimicrobiaceae bacterium]|nr:AI-2E family transporter [Candidatus Deferrimicrobiaceae bacterium]
MRRISLDRATGVSLILLATLGVIALLNFASSVFITVLSSALIALALEPFVQFFCRKAKIGRRVSSMVVGFFATALLYGLFYLLYRSLRQFFTDLPILVEQIRNAPLVQGIIDLVYQITETLSEAGRSIAPPPGATAGKGTEVFLRGGNSWSEAIFHGLGSVTTIMFSLSFIPFLVYFILAEKESLSRKTRELFAEEHQEIAGAIIYDIERMMQRFLVGNAIVAGILSIITTLVFLLVGLPYAVILGILSGSLSTIPYLGLPLALLPAFVVGMVSFDSGVPILVIILVVSLLHLVAVNFLIPKLVGKGVRLNAVAATLSIMFFGWMWGGMGLILGIPIVAVTKCILENVPSTQQLGLWLGE